MDDQQDWELLNGYENGTHTIIQFSRKFDTCDHQDFPITVIYLLFITDCESEIKF